MKLFSKSAAVVSMSATAVILLTPALPLGIPGEWTWQRHVLPNLPLLGGGSLAEWAERLLPAFLAGLLLFAVWFYGERIVDRWRGRPAAITACYVLLLCTGWLWLQAVQSSTPLTHRNLKPLWVLYDPGASGYFFEAAHRIDDVHSFLKSYEDRMAEGEVLHVGTHPPGLFLLSLGSIEACEQSPSLRELVFWCGSSEQREAFRLLEERAFLARPLSDAELAGLQLMSLLTTASAVGVIVPLSVIGWCMFGRILTWRLCCLWLTVPAIAVFLPKSDVLFALTTTSVLALFLCAQRSTIRLRIALAVLAGVASWLGLLLSLAHLPMLVSLCLYAGLTWFLDRRDFRKAIQSLAVLLTTIVLLTLVWNQSTGCNLRNVWSWNLFNHDRFYSQFTRTAWKWLLVNPIELSLAAGLPIALVAARGVMASLYRWNASSDPAERRQVALCLALAGTWLLLLLSGKNQGEAARLWCFLMPWVLLCATNVFDQDDAAASRSDFRRLLICQLLVAVLTVGTVSGFSF